MSGLHGALQLMLWFGWALPSDPEMSKRVGSLSECRRKILVCACYRAILFASRRSPWIESRRSSPFFEKRQTNSHQIRCLGSVGFCTTRPSPGTSTLSSKRQPALPMGVKAGVGFSHRHPKQTPNNSPTRSPTADKEGRRKIPTTLRATFDCRSDGFWLLTYIPPRAKAVVAVKEQGGTQLLSTGPAISFLPERWSW